jgi:hypothetical protein
MRLPWPLPRSRINTIDIGQTAGPGSFFSCIIFGHCPRTGQSWAFELQPSIGPFGIQIETTKHVLEDNRVVIIGDKPQLLRDEIKKIRADAKHEIIVADAPMMALKSLISQNAIESVGGSVQQAWSYSSRLEIVATMEPITPKPPTSRNAGLFVLGYDTFDMQTIGAYQIILTGRM